MKEVIWIHILSKTTTARDSNIEAEYLKSSAFNIDRSRYSEGFITAIMMIKNAVIDRKIDNPNMSSLSISR